MHSRREFAVNQREQFVGRLRIAVFDRLQNSGDVGHETSIPTPETTRSLDKSPVSMAQAWQPVKPRVFSAGIRVIAILSRHTESAHEKAIAELAAVIW